MEMFEVGDVTVTDYGAGYVSYEITFQDDAPTGNEIRIIFDETRRLSFLGDTVSLSMDDIERLRNFLSLYPRLPDQRQVIAYGNQSS